jgi:diguanylate cyclase (GGDEF)-like protein
MLHARDNLPAPGLFIVGYVLIAWLLGLLLVTLHLPDQIMIVMVAPILFTAVCYTQRVYLWALLALTVLALGVTWQISSNWASSLATIVVVSVALLIVGELVYRLVAGRARVEQELEAVRHVGLTLTSSLDPPTVLDAILETTFRLRPGAQDAHIYFYQNERLVFAASLWADGRKNQQFAEPRPDGLTYTVARGRETVAISDIRAHPLFADAMGAFEGAIASIPLKIGQRVVGVMNIAYTKPRMFAATELRVLELLGGQAAIAIENARLFDETRRRVERMAVLNEIGQALTATLKLDELYRVIYQQTSRVLAVDSFFIAIYDELQSAIYFPFICESGRELPSVTRPLDQGPTSQVIQTREVYTLNRASDLERMGGSHFGDANHSSAAALYVPMLAGARTVGVISVQSYREDAYQPDDAQVLATIGAQAAIALENARLYDEVQQLAITDELTGLFNRRGLFQLGQREVERALRFRRPLTAVMLDIDHFKDVNDSYGHPTGDRVLRALTECCRENVRTIDVVGRYGGEEFILLLPETDLTDAIQVAERLRISVESCSVSFGRERLHFTISLGIAELTADIPNLAMLIEHADQAQYLAKQSGRNRVRIFQ